jgi:hypothetical protein
MKHPSVLFFSREVHMRGHPSASISNAARWRHNSSHANTGRIGKMRRRHLWRGHAFRYSSGKTNMGDKIALRARLASRAQPLCLSRPERKKSCNSSPHCFVFPHQGWEGERIFPDSITTYIHEGIPYEVQCFNFVNFTTGSYEADKPLCQKFHLVNPFYDDL